MCTLDQKGDSLRGCRFLSKKPYSLLKKKRKKEKSDARCTPDKFWISRAILVYAVWLHQTSPTNGYKSCHMNCNISTNITVLLFPHAYFRIPWLFPPKCHPVSYTGESLDISHLCSQTVFSYSSTSGLLSISVLQEDTWKCHFTAVTAAMPSCGTMISCLG